VQRGDLTPCISLINLFRFHLPSQQGVAEDGEGRRATRKKQQHRIDRVGLFPHCPELLPIRRDPTSNCHFQSRPEGSPFPRPELAGALTARAPFIL
jgi:hypothetical protein